MLFCIFAPDEQIDYNNFSIKIFRYGTKTQAVPTSRNGTEVVMYDWNSDDKFKDYLIAAEYKV